MTHPAPAPPADNPLTAHPPLSPALRRLFRWTPLASAAPQLGFALIAYFTALQVQLLDPANKVATLALVHTVVACASIAIQPLAGMLSDRTRSRFGARAPWMLGGTVFGAVALVATGLSTSIAMLLVTATCAHIGCHILAGPLSAIQPDRVPEYARGRYSSLAGLGIIAAGVIAPTVGSVFATRIALGYTIGAAAIVAIVVLFLARNPDADNRAVPVPPVSLRATAASMWIDPRRHPDFFWVFLGRFLLFGGYFMIQTFQLYILQDHIGLSVSEATGLTPKIAAICLPGFLLAVSLSGPISDRIGNRKIIVLIGGLTIAASSLIPVAAPTVPGIVASFMMLSTGFGIFISVDQALATQVLPSSADAAKDLGMLNIAAALPNALAPVAAATAVNAFGGYHALYLTVAAVGLVGALAVVPIKAR